VKERILNEILAMMRADTVKASSLQSDGSYKRVRPAAGAAPVRSQEQFIALARRAAFADVSRPSSVEPLLSGAPQRKSRSKRKS
jgi:polyphosphate kinase